MNGFKLTPQEEIELRIAHKCIQNKRYAYRINAVILLGTGWSYEETADALLLDDETLKNYVKRYQTGGINSLVTDHYKGSTGKLDAEHSQNLMCTFRKILT